MIDPISFKSDLLWQLRRSLRERSLKELLTPVVRQGDDRTGLRATVELGGSKYLRSMIGPALRYNLQFHPRIFEIGPCFRTDDSDRTHSQEFTMLDLYVAGESYDFLFSLAEDLVRPFFDGEFTRLSIAECLTDAFGVDLVHAPGPAAATTADRTRQPADLQDCSQRQRLHRYYSTPVYHWVGHGRVLARLRRRHDDAVWALRRAETIHPHRVQRNPFVHEVIGSLLTCTRRDSPAGRELRRTAYRAGLPV